MKPVYQKITTTQTANPVILNRMALPFEATVGVEVPSGTTIAATIQYTLDDLEASASSFASQGFNPNQVGWSPVWQTAGTATATTTFVFSANNTAYPGPVTAVRCVGTTTAGTAMFVVLQGENQRGG